LSNQCIVRIPFLLLLNSQLQFGTRTFDTMMVEKLDFADDILGQRLAIPLLVKFSISFNNVGGQGHVRPSGWEVRKVANGPGFEPSAKGGVSSEGPKLVFCICVYVGATFAWGKSCVASISFHSHIDYNKVFKICGARGPVCLPQAVPVSGSKLCPTE
jgi:hypothetical protein